MQNFFQFMQCSSPENYCTRGECQREPKMRLLGTTSSRPNIPFCIDPMRKMRFLSLNFGNLVCSSEVHSEGIQRSTVIPIFWQTGHDMQCASASHVNHAALVEVIVYMVEPITKSPSFLLTLCTFWMLENKLA